MPLATLKQLWQTIAIKEPRMKLLKAESEHAQYVQYSAVFHFPDLIDIEFIFLDEQYSTINVFSRSVYGYYDFGVNRRRVRRWLDALSNNQ